MALTVSHSCSRFSLGFRLALSVRGACCLPESSRSFSDVFARRVRVCVSASVCVRQPCEHEGSSPLGALGILRATLLTAKGFMVYGLGFGFRVFSIWEH